MKKILICDDHSIIRRGLAYIIASNFTNYDIVTLHSINETIDYIKKNKPNYAILDLQLGDGNMIDVIPSILEIQPSLEILIFSMSNEEIYAKRMIKIGAKGFLNKNSDEDEVIRALKLFLSGKNYFSQKLNDLMIKDIRGNANHINENPFLNLSNRELEVTRYILDGEHIKDISKIMNLHANTIVTYKHRLFEKLYIKSVIDLINLARVYNFE